MQASSSPGWETQLTSQQQVDIQSIDQVITAGHLPPLLSLWPSSFPAAGERNVVLGVMGHITPEQLIDIDHINRKIAAGPLQPLSSLLSLSLPATVGQNVIQGVMGSGVPSLPLRQEPAQLSPGLGLVAGSCHVHVQAEANLYPESQLSVGGSDYPESHLSVGGSPQGWPDPSQAESGGSPQGWPHLSQHESHSQGEIVSEAHTALHSKPPSRDFALRICSPAGDVYVMHDGKLGAIR